MGASSINQRIRFLRRRSIPIFIAAIILTPVCQNPCSAEIDARLVDPYLPKNFSWAMFIEVRDSKPYLNYPGSRLNPLTQIRITANSFSQPGGLSTNTAPAQLYEEFWFHEERPIGLRRFRSLNAAPDSSGAIFLGRAGNNPVAAAKVIVRLAVELDAQELVPSVVQVPLDRYDLIASTLARYSFFPDLANSEMEGPQFSIHMRSYPYGKDGYFYLRH